MFFRAGRTGRGVRFRLTKAGWGFLGATGLVAVTAVNSGLGLLYVMCGCMLGAMYVSAMLGRRMLAGVTVRRELPERCRQNRRVALGYLLQSARRSGAGLAMEIREADCGGVELGPAWCGYLPARQARTVRTEMLPRRRGHLRLGTVRVATTFPFGLLRAARRFDPGDSVVVWPARGRLRADLIGRGATEAASTPPSVRAGGQDEFYGLREYRLGDNARWIHWRRSAGRAEPVIREMARPRPRTLWVLLDSRLAEPTPAARAGRERALRLAGTLIEDALAAGYRVGGAWAREGEVVVVPPGEQRRQRQRLLDALAEVDDNRRTTLSETVGRLRPGWLYMAHVVVIGASAALEAEASAALLRLRRHCRALTVLCGRRVEEVFQDDPEAARREGG